jgi:hypothetical protein
VVQNIPGIQRILSLAGGLTDQRIPFGERLAKQAINNTLGVQVGDADAQWRDADIDRQAGKVLGPVLSSKPIEFIPEELLPELPPAMQKLYMLKKVVGKRQADRKEAIRKAKGFSK